VALSGGGDSLAVLVLASAWAARNGRRLLALTVDHGLHPQSPAWTAFAGQAARRLGAEPRALVWRGDKPATGLSAAARRARHGLLAEAAREAGAATILFGHTADDVAEAEVMRSASTPSLGRLKEWSPSPVWPEGRGLFLLRPFLGTRRRDLRRLLQTKGLAWLEDPANADLRFGRARARLALAETPDVPCGPASSARPDLDLDLLGVRIGAEGSFRLPRAGLKPGEAGARHVLSCAVACAGGQADPVRGAALQRILEGAASGATFTASLGGASIQALPDHLDITREAGSIRRAGAAPMALTAGSSGVFDGRFLARADADVLLAPLDGRAAKLPVAERKRLTHVPAAARAGLPAVLFGGRTGLAQPWGAGPVQIEPLFGARFAAACGLVTKEQDISRIFMADQRQSSYVGGLDLA
jgi:tRNA(Ile)-lysidine synthase